MALEENFLRVDCTLWPKKLGQAPESDDPVAPVWGGEGAELRATCDGGKVLLRWRSATDAGGNTSEFSLNYTLTTPSGPCPTATPSPTPSPTETPLPTFTPEPDVTAGDLDCNGDVTPLDALLILFFLEDLPFDQNEPCPDLDEQLGEFAFADVNCDGLIDITDVMAIILFAADFTAVQPVGCTRLGEPL